MVERSWRDHAIGVFVALHVIVLLTMAVGPRIAAPAPIAQAWRGWFDRVLPVSRTYGNHLGPKQGWSMFSSVSRTNESVRIEGLDPTGRWAPLYVQGEREGWNSAAFRFYRWREFLHLFHDPDNARRTLEVFTEHLAEAIGRERTGVCAVRIRVVTGRIGTAADVRLGYRQRFDTEIRRSRVHRVPGGCP